MTNDDTAPATKADVRMLLDHLKQLYDDMATKEDIRDMASMTELSRTENRILAYLEIVRKDLLDANREEILTMKDRQGIHEERIKRLERVVGVPG